MTNINNKFYDLPKTATISFYDADSDQNLTWEEWRRSQHQSDEIDVINKSGGNFRSEKEGYGPCINDRNCDCSYMAGRSISHKDKNGIKWFKSEVGINGTISPNEYPNPWAEAGIRTSLLDYGGSVGSIQVISGNAGVCAGNGVGIEANLNLVEGDLGPLVGSLGLSANTGANIKDRSINLNAGGWGVTVGRKMAINTSFGSVGIDFGFFLKK